jgi:hypothetical protein
VNDAIDTLKRFQPGPFEASPSAVQRAREDLLRAIQDETANREVRPVHIVSPSRGRHSSRTTRMGRRRRLVVIVATVAAALVVASVLVLAPSGPQTSAAAALSRVAATAALQPPQTPGPTQYYYIQQKVSVIMTAHNPADNSTAQATFVGTENSWVSPNGSGETRQSWSMPIFSSLAEEAVWNAMPGQPYDPLGPLNALQVFFPGQLSRPAAMDKAGFLDVAGLPTQEAQLSQDIENSATGIHSVDDVSVGANTDFERVAILLAGPDVGASPTFASALYGVLSSLPGVRLLGPTMSDSGQSGLGFAAPQTADDPITIILNPSSGAFIELRYNDNSGPSQNGFGGGSSSLALTTSTEWVEPLQSTIAPVSSVPPASGCAFPISKSSCPTLAGMQEAAKKAAESSAPSGS